MGKDNSISHFKQEEKIFGYKHLSFIFKPEFKIENDTLFYKGRRISWDDIRKVTIAEGLTYQLFGIGPAAALRGQKTILTLKSGEEISIRCDLKQKATKFKFRISQLTEDYKWLRDWIIGHVPTELVNGKKRGGPRNRTVIR